MFKKRNYTAPEIYFILRMLPGIGPKKASMMIKDFVKEKGAWYRGLKRRLSEKGIDFKIEGKNLCNVPVDVHVVKVYGRMMDKFSKTPPKEKFLYRPNCRDCPLGMYHGNM